MLFQIILLPLLLGATMAMPNSCSDSDLKWSTKGGNIVLNDKEVFHVKGVSWFGFETETHSPHGLWSFPLSHFLDFLQQNHFNALRVPFSVKLVLENPRVQSVDCSKNPSLCHLAALDLMEVLMDECAKRGILVMLDQHRLQGNDISELWYDSKYSEAKVLESWDVLLRKFATKWNLLSVDLKNEPHGRATWGNTSPSTDWNQAAQRIIRHIHSTHPAFKGLFFVEGVANSRGSRTPTFWGEDLTGVHNHPISTGDASLDKRVVYSPHVYGPGVFNQEYFKASNYPSNMAAIWWEHFGFVESVTGGAIAVGEWGRTNSAPDRQWADAFATFLIDKCLTDNFFWCLNPNSGDTGGLLKSDWKTPETEKLRVVARIQPNPSQIRKSSNGKFCLTPGHSANPKCQGGSPTIPTEKPTPRPTHRPQPSTKSPPVTGVVVEGKKKSSWEEGGEKLMSMSVQIQNGGSTGICGGSEVKMTPGDVRIRSKWNLEDTGTSGVFRLPSWFRLEAGRTDGDTLGMIIFTHSIPKFRLLKMKTC